MKAKIILIFSALVFNISFADVQGPEVNFSKSYAFEYDTQYAKAITPMLEITPATYEVNLRLGWLYYLSKDYTQSQAYYKKAIAQEPSSVEARFGLVLPQSALGNWNDVLAVYQEILKQDPNNSIANYRTASIYYSRKDYTNATTYITKVIKSYPFDYDSNLLYGKILIAQGKTADAKKYLSKALEYNPQSTDVKTELKKVQ